MPEKDRTTAAAAPPDSSTRMRRLLIPLAHMGGVAPRWSGAPLLGLLLAIGCAGPSLMPQTQAAAIRERDRALARHAGAIQEAIRPSGHAGALVFLDGTEGRLVAFPGDTPADAWARAGAAPESEAIRPSAPAVMAFVYRADMPKAPETVTRSALTEQQDVRASVAALQTDLTLIGERFAVVRRELAEALATAKQDTRAAGESVQNTLRSFSDDLAAMRRFMLQIAQLGWLNQEMTVENASGIRKMATASQDLATTSARLQETLRQLSDSLADQLKELATDSTPSRARWAPSDDVDDRRRDRATSRRPGRRPRAGVDGARRGSVRRVGRPPRELRQGAEGARPADHRDRGQGARSPRCREAGGQAHAGSDRRNQGVGEGLRQGEEPGRYRRARNGRRHRARRPGSRPGPADRRRHQRMGRPGIGAAKAPRRHGERPEESRARQCEPGGRRPRRRGDNSSPVAVGRGRGTRPDRGGLEGGGGSAQHAMAERAGGARAGAPAAGTGRRRA